MYRRLQLAKELLADDGVIFVSIDDNELFRLGMLMDRVFGHDHFIANVIWQKIFLQRIQLNIFLMITNTSSFLQETVLYGDRIHYRVARRRIRHTKTQTTIRVALGLLAIYRQGISTV